MKISKIYKKIIKNYPEDSYRISPIISACHMERKYYIYSIYKCGYEYIADYVKYVHIIPDECNNK